jgi:hypothetical protein
MQCADMDVRVAACHALCPLANEPGNKARIDEAGGIGTQFTCFTGTNVQILTQKALVECLIQTMRSHIGHTQLQIFGCAALVSIAQSADIKVKVGTANSLN